MIFNFNNNFHLSKNKIIPSIHLTIFFFIIREFSIRGKYYTFMYSSFQYNPNSFVYMHIYANIITINRFNFYIKQKNYLHTETRDLEAQAV